MSRFPFDAVLFDCDGVLVDSEPLVARVLSEMLTARGWPLTPAQAGEVFLGQSVAHLAGLIAERTGKPFTEQWLEEFRQQRNRALEQDLEAIQGGARGRACDCRGHRRADCLRLRCRPVQGEAAAGQGRHP